MNAQAIPKAESSSLANCDYDQAFSGHQLSDTALTAAIRVSARFDPHFPGWFLYRRVVAGVGIFDRHLEASAIMAARVLARSHKVNGRDYIRAESRRPDWIAQAGRDALDFAIYGKYAAGLNERGEHFKVSPKTYQAIRDPVGKGLWIGLRTFQAEIHNEYFKVYRRDRGMG